MNLSESSGLESSAAPLMSEDLSSTVTPSPALNPSSAAATSRGWRSLGFVIFLVLTRQTLPTFFDQRQSKNRRNSLWTQGIGKRILCLMTLSARNRLEGKVTEIQFGGVMAHVVVRVGKSLVESVITKRSVEEMKLKVGDKVTAVIKSTEVMLDKS